MDNCNRSSCAKPDKVSIEDHIKFEHAIWGLEASKESEWEQKKQAAFQAVSEIKEKYCCSAAGWYEHLYNSLAAEPENCQNESEPSKVI